MTHLLFSWLAAILATPSHATWNSKGSLSLPHLFHIQGCEGEAHAPPGNLVPSSLRTQFNRTLEGCPFWNDSGPEGSFGPYFSTEWLACWANLKGALPSSTQGFHIRAITNEDNTLEGAAFYGVHTVQHAAPCWHGTTPQGATTCTEPLPGVFTLKPHAPGGLPRLTFHPFAGVGGRQVIVGGPLLNCQAPLETPNSQGHHGVPHQFQLQTGGFGTFERDVVQCFDFNRSEHRISNLSACHQIGSSELHPCRQNPSGHPARGARSLNCPNLTEAAGYRDRSQRGGITVTGEVEHATLSMQLRLELCSLWKLNSPSIRRALETGANQCTASIPHLKAIQASDRSTEIHAIVRGGRGEAENQPSRPSVSTPAGP